MCVHHRGSPSEVHKDEDKTNSDKNHNHITTEAGMRRLECTGPASVGPSGGETSWSKVTPWLQDVTAEQKASSSVSLMNLH